MARYLPMTIFIVLAGLFALLLAQGKDPSRLPSALIGKPAPAMAGLSFGAAPVLVNFFASWCLSCGAEQKVLSAVAKDKVVIYGIDYKDEKKPLRKWLAQHGNPYAAIGDDRDGRAGIEWGITGVPESFVVDRAGVVRYRYAGPVTEEVYRVEIAPLLAELNK